MALKAKEIAELIGVSQATLSLVVNNKQGISAQTRQRVISELKARGFDYLLNGVVDDENYISSRKTIGFVNYRVGGELLGEDSFLPLILDSLETRARKYGYNLAYINISRENVQNEIQNIKLAECQGIAIFATEMKEKDIEPFLKLGIPFVLLDNYYNNLPINTVKVNNEQGTYIAVRYLYELGHRKVGYLQSGVDINSFRERCENALHAMKEFCMESPEKYVWEVGYPFENAYLGMKRLLEHRPELPTAFLADNDLVSAGAMKAVKEAGYQIPDDVSFIGFDDRPICLLVEPQLSTVRLPRQYFGAEAIELLIRILSGDADMQVKLEINTELVLRKSTATKK